MTAGYGGLLFCKSLDLSIVYAVFFFWILVRNIRDKLHWSIASVVITIYLDSLYLIQFESETEVFKQLCGKLIKTSVLRKDHKFCHVKHYILLSVILWYLIFNPGKTATKSTQKTFFGPRRRGEGGCVCVTQGCVTQRDSH